MTSPRALSLPSPFQALSLPWEMTPFQALSLLRALSPLRGLSLSLSLSPSGVVTASDNQSSLGAVEVTVSPSDASEDSSGTESSSGAVAVTVAPSGVVTASDNQSPLGAVEVTVSPSDASEDSSGTESSSGAVAVTVAPSVVRDTVILRAAPSLSDSVVSRITTTTTQPDDENSELNQPVTAADKEAEVVISTMAGHPPSFTAVSVFQDPITYTAYRPFGIDEPHDGDYSLSARWKYYTSTLVFLFFLFYYMIYIVLGYS